MRQRRWSRIYLVLVLISTPWLSTCSHCSSLPPEHHAYYILQEERIQPEALHIRSYLNMVACVQPEPPFAPFEAIHWYEAERIVQRGTGLDMAGIAVVPANRVYIARPWRRNASVIEHEILHVLLPFVDHEDPEFAACDPIPYTPPPSHPVRDNSTDGA